MYVRFMDLLIFMRVIIIEVFCQNKALHSWNVRLSLIPNKKKPTLYFYIH